MKTRRNQTQTPEPTRPYDVIVRMYAADETTVIATDRVTVEAATDGQANSRAMMFTRLRPAGNLVLKFEVMADGTERPLLLNC